MTDRAIPTGHRINIERLKIDLHHLLCIFLASSPLSELINEEPEYAANKMLLRETEEVEATHLLLSTAIALRVLDDMEDGNLDCFSLHCGTLTENHPKSKAQKEITLRETCNKIIHATDVLFDRSSHDTQLEYLNPYLNLKGTKTNGITWNAIINVYKFAREGLQAIHGLKSR